MNEGDTHYEVLGVGPGSSKDAIRAAYRDELTEAQSAVTREETAKRPSDGAIAAARQGEARVRAAWQVLSDPIQRQRYDESNGIDNTGVDLDEELSDDDPADGGELVAPDRTPDRRTLAREAREERLANRPPGMFSTEVPPTPASWPPGFRPPPPRARSMALGIDMIVLVFIVLAQFIITPIVVEQMKPVQADRLDVLTVQIDRATVQKDRAETRADNANGGEARRAATADAKVLDKKIDRLETEQTDLRNEVLPITLGFSLLGVALSLLYLIPISVRTGRTFGKRSLQIRAVMVDGSPLTLRGALRRYGTPMILGWMLANIFGPLGYMMVLFGVLTWPRNPSFQGLQDRLAKTIVVDG